MRSLLFAAIFCLFLMSVPAASGDSGIQPVPDRLNAVLATVNGEPISLGDVLPLTQAREYQAAAAYSGEKLERAVYDLRLSAVDDLIDQKLILADYAGRPFEVPERDVESALDEASEQMGCRSRADLVRKLRESGTSVEEFRKKIRKQLIVQLMLYREYQASNFITPGDLFRYYEEHGEEFSRPDCVELAMLQLPPERNDVEKITEEISRLLAADPE